MTQAVLNTQLYQKMFAEQAHFKNWLMSQPPEEVLNHAYEYTCREDILLSLEYNDLSPRQAKALLKSPTPLADVFKKWEATVDTASIKHDIEKTRQEKESAPAAPEKAAPKKDADDMILDELLGAPIQKEQPSPENPTAAKTEKSPPSEPTSGTQRKTAEGTAKESRPSVREELREIRRFAALRAAILLGIRKAPTSAKSGNGGVILTIRVDFPESGIYDVEKRQVGNMPFEIVRNDITKIQVDAIVNTANPRPVIGSGVDAGIHRAAGPELLTAREKIGRIGVGEAAITPGFGLNAKYVIHTVGPVWRGGLLGEGKLLRSCYESSLALALENGCESIAFPLISSGNYGFPKDKALQIALDAIRGFLNDHEMMVSLVVFDREAFQLSRQRYREVASFIDDNYIQEKTAQQISPHHARPERVLRDRDALDDFCAPMECAEPAPPRAARKNIPLPYEKPKPRLADLLAETDAGFSETLLKLIDKTGKKDSEIYTKANLSRQHFSKIRNNPHYQPTKPTAIALALALELDLEQTRDLIGRAGYALTNSSKFDVIIMYFIREKNYNLFDINAALFEFDQSLLGAQ